MSGKQLNLPFMSSIRATTQGEVWDHTDQNKFDQFGWRSSKRDDVYRKGVLVGNWVEEKQDLQRVAERKCLPSQFSHYYDTTYNLDYKQSTAQSNDSEIRKLKGRNKYAFPAHQPELDLPPLRKACDNFNTISKNTYVDHFKSKS